MTQSPRPTFERHVSPTHGRPLVVTIRPTYHYADEYEAMAALATFASHSIVQAVRNYNHASIQQTRIRTSGYLSATNLINGVVHTYSKKVERLVDLDFAMIAEILGNIQQSNDLLLLSDIEWRFAIDPTSVTLGGATTSVTIPSWAPKKYKPTWLDHDEISCAALSLVYLMYDRSRRYGNRPNRALSDAWDLMQQLGWSKYTSMSQLEDFTNQFPIYRYVACFVFKNRLSVITPTLLGQYPITYTGQNYENKNLYIFFQPTRGENGHFSAIKSPQEVLRSLNKTGNIYFCHPCYTSYYDDNHTCENTSHKRIKLDERPCPKGCGKTGSRHDCHLVKCKTCPSTVYERENGFDHRCIIYKEKIDKQFSHEDGDGKQPNLWAYDIEARVEIKHTAVERIVSFKTDPENPMRYIDANDATDVAVYDFRVQKHVANMVVAINQFNQTMKIFKGDDCLEQFVLYMQAYNRGNNILLAHNAAGYDSRLVFDAAHKVSSKVKMDVILRGAKFMQLTVGDCIFRDSLLHVKGSLKALAKDFCSSDEIRKGYFPHLFNTIENWDSDYRGCVPDKSYFDLSFSCRSQRDLDEFEEWYASRKSLWDTDKAAGVQDQLNRGLWVFREEMEAYCINDVFVLGKIMMGYHQAAFDKFEMSPWMNATAPSFVHDVYIMNLSLGLELDEIPEEQKSARIQEIARKEFWAVLKPNEYWFARRALRGGRTEIKQVYRQVSDQEWARGVRIRYQDICSEYPYQQVIHNFPVGLPTCFIYDRDFQPCATHQNSKQEPCDCMYESRFDRYLDIKEINSQPTSQQFLADLCDPRYCGIVCATVVPPSDLWHPLLMYFDHRTGKCTAANERIERGYWPTPLFKRALEIGYTLEKLHRYDRYHSKPSLWRDIMLDLFMEKMINSKATPTGNTATQLIDGYRSKFGDDLGDMVEKSIVNNTWGKHAARKQTAKVMMNSAWGKHAQRPVMPKSVIYNCDESGSEIFKFFQDCSTSKLSFLDGYALGEDKVHYKYLENTAHIQPNLHGGYLPAALFVTCYGQLQLWEQMNAIDQDPENRRVLMCDTDSIVYIYDPETYNIPQGSLLGEWEVEDEDSMNGGIREFVGMGPKTYGFKCDNGYTKVKAKGISVTLASSDLVNFGMMKSIVCDHLAGETARSVLVPQTNFVWSQGQGIRTYRMLKELKFNFMDMKGNLNCQTGFIEPFGYNITY